MLPNLFFDKYRAPEYYRIVDPRKRVPEVVSRYDRFPTIDLIYQWGKDLAAIFGPHKLYACVLSFDLYIAMGRLMDPPQRKGKGLGWDTAVCFHNWGAHVFLEGATGVPSIGCDDGRIYPIESIDDRAYL